MEGKEKKKLKRKEEEEEGPVKKRPKTVVNKKLTKVQERQALTAWKVSFNEKLREKELKQFSISDLWLLYHGVHTSVQQKHVVDMYIRILMIKTGKWDTDAVDMFVRLMQGLPERVQVSQRDFLTLFHNVLSKVIGSQHNILCCKTDPVLLEIMTKVFEVVGISDDAMKQWCGIFLDTLERNRHRARKPLDFVYDIWKASLNPCALINRNKFIQPTTGKSYRYSSALEPQARDFFRFAPIPFLEWWLQSLERKNTALTYPIVLPSFEQAIELGIELEPVRCRMMERAYALCSHPVYVTFPSKYRNIPVYVPMICRIVLEAPVVFYRENAVDAPTSPEIFTQMHGFRNAFIIRSPKIMLFHKDSIVWNELYENKTLWKECTDVWDSELTSYLLPELSRLVQSYMYPQIVSRNQHLLSPPPEPNNNN